MSVVNESSRQWFISNSLKFRVGRVFVNGKMTVSLAVSALIKGMIFFSLRVAASF